MKLRLALPIQPGESPQSFVSRLAALHRLPSHRFCSDLGVSIFGVANGHSEDITLVADLSGVPLERLAADAMVQSDDHWLLRGQKLIKPSMRRDRMMYCAGCLRNDVVSSDLPHGQAAYGRSVWMVASIKTCLFHGLALSIDEKPERNNEGYDFAFRCRPLLSRLDGLVAQAVHRPASSFERYLLDRLEHGTGTGWLDRLAFHAAARTCEIVGSVATFGKTQLLEAMSEDDWQRAAAAGFDICHGGESSIRSFLGDMVDRYVWGPSGNDGAQQILGGLYSWLAYGAKSPDFDPVRALVRTHILETVPMAAGSEVFGAIVQQRRIHSIRSFAKEMKKDPRRIRVVLAEAGILPNDHVGKLDAAVHFGSDISDVVLNSLNRLRLSQVAEHLNMPGRHVEILAKAKRIPAATHRDEHGGLAHRFEPAALNEFMERLSTEVCGFAETSNDVHDIVRASKAVHCKVIDIVDLLLARRLKWVARRRDVEGFMGLLVNITEVKSVLNPGIQGVPVCRMKAEFGSSWFAVNALIAEGVIPSKLVERASGGEVVRIVSEDDFRAFSAKYVCLPAWAKEKKMRLAEVRLALKKRGIVPALDRKAFRTLIYERAALDS